ncbi:putative B-block-binding subunit of tfiiic protein [Cucumis melo var. makuwa]|uniref:B-block-binding subunit of tfiiic protein n=1 Tax=Cucumis melo var. makuwa TaxID=1194695 RepID=A0A5D3DK63_CUCMM|nr:putative B-block-binding subunit of tfiiic protein [Cucumis melo var. makuwa]TYK23659.1 putative B-block-binding subunit of tfiiic protein [Cucumis melo var. makuwa]
MLLELMVLDSHIRVRKMYQSKFSGPPGILGALVGRSSKESKFVCRDHYFANPMSSSLLVLPTPPQHWSYLNVRGLLFSKFYVDSDLEVCPREFKLAIARPDVDSDVAYV